MATKIMRVCDNCKHETKVGDPEEKPKGWWEGSLPTQVGTIKAGHPVLICDGCVGGIQSALVLRRKGSQRDVGAIPPS